MKSKFSIVIILILFGLLTNMYSQPMGIKRVKGMDTEIHMRQGIDEIKRVYIPRSKRKTDKKQDIQFNVDYIGQINPAARAAFEDGVLAIINDHFSSPVPINIELTWDVFQAGALAGASPATYYSNLPNVPLFNRVYPVALAEKIARVEINSPDEPDLEVVINSTAEWYYDFTNPGGIGTRFDFVSTLLHEVIHGLGFLSNTFVDADDLGYLNIFTDDTYYVYNEFLELGPGQRLVDVVDESIAMGQALTSDGVSFILPSTLQDIQIYAPSVWEPGSSMSHIDDQRNTITSLMTPAAMRGEQIHTPGIATDMLYDMGWDMTYLLHSSSPGSEELDQDYVVEVEVISDSPYDPNTLKLVYSTDEFATQSEAPLVLNEATGMHEATLSANNSELVYQYYVTVTNERNIKFTNPGEAPLLFYEYLFSLDTELPVISHRSQRTINNIDPSVLIDAIITDEFIGVDEAYVEWRYNGVDQERVDFVQLLDFSGRTTDDYAATLVFPNGPPEEDDIVEYRLVVIDGSKAKNTKLQPVNGGYLKLTVVPVAGSVVTYINDFDSATEDFDGDGFSITMPAGFTSDAIHSTHPYPEPNNAAGFTNLIYELAIPIKIDAQNPKIVFDEIAIIEPGEPGVPFGEDEFWDYAIVEGKKLGSSEWLPFLNGYDARAKFKWLTAYNAGFAGAPDMYSERKINMLSSGHFEVGDEVLIRFRLFSDPAVNGWGWAIDNLVIQDLNSAVEDFVLSENFSIIPNPAYDQVTVAMDLENTSEAAQIKIIDIYGRVLMTKPIDSKRKSIREKINISHLPDGVYIINVAFNDRDVISKKLIKQ